MRAFARSIVETVRHPLLILDSQLCVVTANQLYYSTFGTNQDEIVGQRLFELQHGRWNTADLRKLIEILRSQGRGFDNFEIEQTFSDQERRILVLNARRVARDEDGTPMVLLAIQDDTERRQAQVALRQMNCDLEQRIVERTAELESANQELLQSNLELAATNRELEAFCYAVSHDLRAPLRAVDGFSQELLQGYAGRLDEQGLHYLTRVRHATQRMGQLIDDLLKLSRVTRVEMTRQTVDLSTIVELISTELQQRDSQRPIKWKIQPHLTACADPELMHVALQNLLENAWKFTGHTPEPIIEFQYVATGKSNKPAICVRDNGAGFDPQFTNKLFGAFQRLHSEREFPGTGVGLATVQRIIHRHGGEIWAEGAMGSGAAFYLTLPDMEMGA